MSINQSKLPPKSSDYTNSRYEQLVSESQCQNILAKDIEVILQLLRDCYPNEDIIRIIKSRQQYWGI